MENKALCDLRPGERAQIKAILTKGGMRRRLLDIGLIENTEVTCVGVSPGGDPGAYLIRGAVIAIRARDGRDILISSCRPSPEPCPVCQRNTVCGVCKER